MKSTVADVAKKYFADSISDVVAACLEDYSADFVIAGVAAAAANLRLCFADHVIAVVAGLPHLLGFLTFVVVEMVALAAE